MRARRLRSALQLMTASLAFACSPVASFRPASGLMPGRHLEVGAGLAAVGPRPYVMTETWQKVGQAWATGNASDLVTLSAITAFDDDAIAAGGAFRLNAIRADRFAGGFEAEAGYAWMGASLPMAVRLFDQSWLYVTPRLGTWGIEPIYGTIVGGSFRIYDGFILRAEWQRSWQDFKYYNRRDTFGAAAAYQF
jgi:hypothetical protein